MVWKVVHQHGDNASGGVELAAPHPAHLARAASGSAPFQALSCSPGTRRPLLPRPAPWAAPAAPSAAAGDAVAPSPLSAVHRAVRTAPGPSRASPRGLISSHAAAHPEPHPLPPHPVQDGPSPVTSAPASVPLSRAVIRWPHHP